MMKNILLLMLLFSFPVFTQIKSPKFDRITAEDGLTQSSVFCILQDSKGFMWFGTQGGLHSYDGYKFTVYKNNPFDSTSLSDNWVQALAEDKKGNIWAGTHNGGVYYFNRNTKKFTNFRHKHTKLNSLSNNRIWNLHFDKSGKLWIGSSGGLDMYDPINKTFHNFGELFKDSLGNETIAVNYITEDKTGNLWLGTWGAGLFRFNPKTRELLSYNKYFPEYSLRIKSMYLDGDDKLWIGTRGSGLFSFDIHNFATESFQHNPSDSYSISSNALLSVITDKKGNIWIGTYDKGLAYYDRLNKKFYSYTSDSRNLNSICNNWVQSVYEDRAGIIWIGTGEGINKFTEGKQLFTSIKGDPNNLRGLSAGDITSLTEDKEKNLWIGTWNGGLIKYDQYNHTFTTYKSDTKGPLKIPGNIVTALLEDSYGTLWIGTTTGLGMLDKETGKLRIVRNEPDDPASLSYNNISFIMEDRNFNIWIGTWGGGLNLYNRSEDSFTRFPVDPDDPDKLNDGLINSILEGRSGEIFIATNSAGFSIYSPMSNKFKNFSYVPNNKNSLSNNSVKSMLEDNHGNLWIATAGGGLNKFERKNNKFVHYTEKEGLSNDMLFRITNDAKGNIWISSNKGVSCFNPTTENFYNFDIKDGLGDNEFSMAFCRSGDGKILFGGRTGITQFHPDSIFVSAFNVPIVLRSFKVFNEELDIPIDISDLKEVELAYSQNVFSIDFAALEYLRPDKVQYAYKLEGFDKNWNYSGNRRNAYYTNLDPGNYTFRVKASNGSDVWKEMAVPLKLRVIPPFYLTWWFIGIIFVIILTLIFGIYRYRVNQLLQIERLRTRIAADLHDEIASNLSSIYMFNKIIQNDTAVMNSPNSMLPQMIDRISTLSQDSVAAIRDIIWAIDPKTETIYNILIKIRDSFISITRAKNITLNFNIPSKEYLPQINLSPEQRKNIWLLLKESINNCVKHSSATTIDVRILYYEAKLRINITDNGIGFDTEKQFSGKGMNTMKKRIKDLQGEMIIKSAPDDGTAIKITFPL